MTSPISRRKFLLLAATSGIAAIPEIATAGQPSPPTGGQATSHPNWVRTVQRAPMWLDDSNYARFDKRRCVFPSSTGGSLALYVGAERERTIQNASREAAKRLAGRAGFRPRDRALALAARTVSYSNGGPNVANRGILAWDSPAQSSEEALPSDGWGNPAQATSDVKAAARFFGASLVGIAQLDPRHIYSHDLDGKAIAFEDVRTPYEDATHRVIPSNCRYAIVYAVQMSGETVKRAPTALATAASNMAYSLLAQVGASLAQFLRAMGYLAIPCVNDTAVSIPLAVEAGLGELARHNRLITPEYGPMVRLGKLFTDLPLAVDQPIDAGIKGFCSSCAKCAEACPAGAISMAPAPDHTPKGPWNNAGHEAWFEDSVKCFSYSSEINTNCMICFSVCPYSKKDRAAVHGLVKATIAQTSLLNGVIRSVDDAFGYGGQKSPDGWWDLDLPPLGQG
jgi:epoxyqueuosine reductase